MNETDKSAGTKPDENPYRDIIHLSHHQSETHPHMSNADRAAQFSPFAALTGYGETIDEKARYTEGMIRLDDDRKQEIDCMLQQVASAGQSSPPVRILYFLPDRTKEGGSFERVSERVAAVHREGACLEMASGKRIPFDHILKMEWLGGDPE